MKTHLAVFFGVVVAVVVVTALILAVAAAINGGEVPKTRSERNTDRIEMLERKVERLERNNR